jgi:hypothetical protein
MESGADAEALAVLDQALALDPRNDAARIDKAVYVGKVGGLSPINPSASPMRRTITLRRGEPEITRCRSMNAVAEIIRLPTANSPAYSLGGQMLITTGRRVVRSDRPDTISKLISAPVELMKVYHWQREC